MKKKLPAFNYDFPKRIIHFKNTKDFWAGNYDGDQVKIQYHGVINPWLRDADGFIFRVSVWGNDDTGIIKDFNNHLEAKQLFNKLDSMKYISQQDCIDLGMEYF